LARTWFSAP